MKILIDVLVLMVTSGLGVMNIVKNLVMRDVSLTLLVLLELIGILSIIDV